MADSALNRFLARGTTAQRTAFTPNPPTPASGPPAHAILWYDTDVDALYSWNGAAWELAALADNEVTNAKLDDMAAARFKLRASGAGTGDPIDGTANQASTILDGATDPFIRTSAAPSAFTDEKAQDAVGAMVDGTTLEYIDATPLLRAKDDGIDNAKLANMAQSRIKLRAAGAGTGDPIDGTPDQASTVLDGATDPFVRSSVGALVDDGNSGTTKTIDWGSKYWARHKLTLTGSVTLTLSNPVTGGTYVLLLYTGAGSFTVTWPGTVKWPAGTAPTITATASRLDLVTLIWDGTDYFGSFNQNYTP